jgi:hypothetical protein
MPLAPASKAVLLTAEEAAQRYRHASTKAFYEWLKRHRGAFRGVIRRGRRILIDPEQFERSLARVYGE